MSNRASPTVKPARIPKPKKPASPAAAAASVVHRQAYTSADYDRDRPRPCPSNDPAKHCRPRKVPHYYRSLWRQHVVLPARKSSPAEPFPRERRELSIGKVICTDCRLFLQQEDRNAFAAEFGDHGLGFMRPTPVRDVAELERLAEERAQRDFLDIYTLAAEPAEPIDWREARVLAGHVRSLTRAYAEALARLAAGERRGAGPKRGPCQCYACLHTRLPTPANAARGDRR